MIELYNHQKTALAFMRINNFFALFMEQGCGKTLPSLIRILELLKSGKIEDALVVAPKSALGAWERDMELFDPEDRETLGDNVTIINYDKVWRSKTYEKPWGCIILDEAHFIKNRTSKRSAFLLKLATQSAYRYILTGTPISNGQLENIWALYTFLDPVLYRGRVRSGIFDGPYSQFLERYCILNMYHKPATYIHVEELQEIIAAHSYRVKKEDCLDLPEKLPDEVVKVGLKGKAKTIYKKLATESAVAELDILAENPLARLVKLRQIASGFLKNDNETFEFESEKIAILKELLEGFADDQKIVLFAEFKNSIKDICKLLEKLKYNFVTLDGEQKNKTIWRDFQSDKTIKIIVCQYQTAHAGIDLFASDTIIYYEPTLRSNVLEQSRDRIHRSGQKNKCSYIHILTRGTIEIDIYRTLAGYADFTEKLFTEKIENYRRGRC